jgi:hypothetical protein
MAAHARYSTPPEQLVEVGALARRQGLSFEQFWARAVHPVWPDGKPRLVTMRTEDPPALAVCWPNDGEERKLWRMAVIGTEDVWRSAYERRDPSAPALAVYRLQPLGGGGLVARDAVVSAA